MFTVNEMKNGFLVVFLSVCLFYGECGDNDFDYETEIATTHLDLLEMDLEDHCSNLSVADRNILMKKPNAYKIKVMLNIRKVSFKK